LLVVVPTVSATYKSYDEITKTITLTDSFLFIPTGTIAEIKLDTPILNRVGVGYVRVAEYTVTGQKDYDDFYGEIKTYDNREYKRVGDKATELNKEFDLKYKTTEEYQAEVTTCPDEKLIEDTKTINTTETSKCIISYETREREVWLPFNKDTKIEDGVITTIGVYTTTKAGEVIEWVPEFADKEIYEWAVFSASLRTDLIAYWDFDENTGILAEDAVDSVYNLTGVNTPTWTENGLINNATNLSSEYWTRPVGDLFPAFGQAYTINTWINLNQIGISQYVISKAGDNSINYARYHILIDSSTNKPSYFIHDGGGAQVEAQGNTALTTNQWYMITARYDGGTNMTLWIDGKQEASAQITSFRATGESPFYIGRSAFAGVSYTMATIDETGFWNRSLTPTEILNNLYNDGDGLAYSELNDNIVEVNFISPVAEFNTSTTLISFNCSAEAFGTGEITNGTLQVNYTNGTNVYENIITDITNNTYMNFEWEDIILADGSYTWNCFANGYDYTTTDTRNILVDTTYPTINVTAPTGTYQILYDNKTLNLNYSIADTTSELDSCWISYQNGDVEKNAKGGGVFTHNKIGEGFTMVNIYLTLLGGGVNVGNFEIPDSCIVDNFINLSYWNQTGIYCSTGEQIYDGNAKLRGSLLFYDEINCSLNTTQFNYTKDINNLTVYSNDTFGNENSNLTEWDYKVFENGQDYDSEVYETQTSSIAINLTYDTSKPITVILNYDNINYSSTSTTSGYFVSSEFNIPLINESAIRTFYWIISYDGFVMNSTINNQTISPLVFNQCDTTYTIQTLNFTFFDELNQTNLNASTYATSILTNFNYWIGDGSLKKNYTFQNLSSSLNSYQFCLNANETIYIDLDMQYFADDYSERTYYYRNETIDNTTKDVLLYSLLSSETTKFFVNIKQATDVFTDAVVKVWRYFVGLGDYAVVMIGLTDDNGQFVANLDIDQTYNFTVIKDNYEYGGYEKQSTCLTSPCELDINIGETALSGFVNLKEYFAQNIEITDNGLWNNRTSKTISIDFLDTTGTSSYWRLYVYTSYYINDTVVSVCDVKAYSSSGTLSCNYSNYSGDMVAKLYISRSPEKLVDFINFVNDNAPEIFGASAILASIILLCVIIFSGTMNPVIALIEIPFALAILKFIGFIPLDWSWIAGLTIFILWIAHKMNT